MTHTSMPKTYTFRNENILQTVNPYQPRMSSNFQFSLIKKTPEGPQIMQTLGLEKKTDHKTQILLQVGSVVVEKA